MLLLSTCIINVARDLFDGQAFYFVLLAKTMVNDLLTFV